MRIKKNLANNQILVTISLSAIVLIFFTSPFLKIPYDVWEHLIRIASFHDEGKSFIFWPEDRVYAMYHWHLAWGYFFRLISVNDIFTWAKIIHVSQSILAWICMVFFCSRFIRLTLPNINNFERQLYIILSVLLWFIGNGTYSVAYQQAWVLWYSVSYQGLTLPLYWYILALTIDILYDEALGKKARIAFFLQIVVIFPLTIVLHPSEGIFYCVAVLMMSCFRHQYIFKKIKEYWLPFTGGLIVLLIFGIVLIETKIVLLPKIISNFGAPAEIYSDFLNCMKDWGHMNKFPESFSEIALFSLAAGLFTLFILRFRPRSIAGPIFHSQLMSAIIFFLIPIIPFTFGIAAVFTHRFIVWRFFFASPWFILLPIFIYVILPTTSWQKRYAFSVLLVIGIPSAAVAISYHFYPTELFENQQYCPAELPGHSSSGALFGNVRSLAKSLGDGGRYRYGIQFTKEDIGALKLMIDARDIETDGKKNIFYIRGDTALIVRGVFRKYVYTHRTSMYEKASFLTREESNKYNLIEIDLPEKFPKDGETFRCFYLEKK